MASNFNRNRMFSLRIFQSVLQYSRQRPSFSAHMAALMTKADLTFRFGFVYFAAQFCFLLAASCSI